jgi:hypothetical protein
LPPVIATCPAVELEFLYSVRSLADRWEKLRRSAHSEPLLIGMQQQHGQQVGLVPRPRQSTVPVTM